MAPQPTGDATLTDKDLDEAVESMFEEGDETPTEAPAAAPRRPVPGRSLPTLLQPDTAPAGDETPGCRCRSPDPSPPARPAAPVEGKPFQFKASGGVKRSLCAHELPDGSVVIPKDAPPISAANWLNGRELQANFTRTKRELRPQDSRRPDPTNGEGRGSRRGDRVGRRAGAEDARRTLAAPERVPRQRPAVSARPRTATAGRTAEAVRAAGEGPAVERGGAARAVHRERAGRAGGDLRVSRSGRRVQGIDARGQADLAGAVGEASRATGPTRDGRHAAAWHHEGRCALRSVEPVGRREVHPGPSEARRRNRARPPHRTRSRTPISR
jgi:hypothetical protein